MYHYAYKPSPAKTTHPIPPILGRPLAPPPHFQWTAHWGLGRAGRGAREPGPASGAASLAAPPPRVVPDEAAAPWSRTSPDPRLRQRPEWHEEEEEAGG